MAPLDGVTVLDFSTLLPGPLASLILAEAGARVIKVERPGTGDEMRGYPPFAGADSIPFALLNRGKESLSVDLKSQVGRAALAPYLARADILIEQFRPGVMDRLGLGYADLAARYPGLIYCSITGYGQTGPLAPRAGHDLNYMAETGLLALSMGPGAAPVVPPAQIADIAGGSYPAAINILLALAARRRTGQGAHLDISMTDNLYPLMWWALARHAADGRAPGNGADLLTGGTARYRLYPAKDGRIVAVGAIEDRFWQRFCAAIEMPPELADDRRDPAATLAETARRIAAQPGAHWARVFEAADCCCSVVQDIAQAQATPHFVARGLGQGTVATPMDHGVPALPVPVVPMFRSARAGARPAPGLGDIDGD